MPNRIDALLPDETIIIDGKATRNFSVLIQRMTDQLNLNTALQGVGSPEGFRTAPQGQIYWDTSGAPYEEYVKTTKATLDTGWVKVT